MLNERDSERLHAVHTVHIPIHIRCSGKGKSVATENTLVVY